jgi:hypothetical protein
MTFLKYRLTNGKEDQGFIEMVCPDLAEILHLTNCHQVIHEESLVATATISKTIPADLINYMTRLAIPIQGDTGMSDQKSTQVREQS